AQAGKSYEIMDVASASVEALFEAADATVIIHGHTHRPAVHETNGKLRYVLPDWELDAAPRRGGWIELAPDGTLTQHGIL
ncbi:MAG: UDP-2,3-diacylglucosamine diphosphatase, partial [Massilia sp.]